MKRLLMTTVTILTVLNLLTAQTVLDTRTTNEPPTFYNQEIKFEFKQRDVLGVSGDGFFSGLWTFAPWHNNSGGEHYQLNLNSGGMFYRTGLPDNPNWNDWRRVLTTNSNNNLYLDGKVSLTTNDDAVLSFNNTDNGWQYVQFKQSGVRKAYLGINQHNDFMIRKENGGDIFFAGANVGIGINSPQHELDVCGVIRATEVLVEDGWCDFVFVPEYCLTTLEEEEDFIKLYGHLSNFESAKDMNGEINVNDIFKRQQIQIEENVLHLIELNAENKALQVQVDDLKDEVVLLNDKVTTLAVNYKNLAQELASIKKQLR